MIDFSVVCFVAESYCVAFYRDATFPFDVHRIQELVFKFALGDCAASLNQAVCERRFAMVDMSNDAKVANVFHIWCVAVINHKCLRVWHSTAGSQFRLRGMSGLWSLKEISGGVAGQARF